MSLPPPAPGSTCLVTGASSGIGAEIARELADRGHGVVLVARRVERLRELADELAAEHGVRAEALACDLGDTVARDQLAAELDGLGLDVEVLVNNAGFGTAGRFGRHGRDRELQMVRVNVEAVIDLCARYLPAMVERGRGAILNVASTAAFQPMPGSASYGATKAMVLSFGEALHNEYSGKGVTVTTVCPGPVKTEFVEAARMHGTEDAPGFVWSTAEDVAADAVRGLERGKRVVIPGRLNAAGAFAGRHTPRSISLRAVSRFWPG